MGLQFIFLLITRVATWLRLSRLTKHGRLQRSRSCATSSPSCSGIRRAEADLGTPCVARDPARPDTPSAPQRLRPLVTPDTILRWHRDIVRHRWAAMSTHYNG